MVGGFPFDYTSFFGSIQIDKNVELTSSLWLYGIHSDNSEIISLLEEKCPKPKLFKDCLIEAVKCHHNNMANYLQNNYSSEICFIFFRFYNFSVKFQINSLGPNSIQHL